MRLRIIRPLPEVIEGFNLAHLKFGESYEINLANGGEVIEFNDAYKLPADVKAAGEKALAGITDGSIKTGVAGS